MEAKGFKPLLVEGKPSNIKVTRPQDLEQARLMITTSSALRPRLGNGYDVHAFEPGDHVTLGGVKIPHSQGLKAHSDGDVALHALMDAMLGALALGDIGTHFPDTDERWKGADSRVLLRAVNELIRENGYQVGNADLTIIAQRPKMAPHIGSMAEHIADDLGLVPQDVGVKATTTEKLGFCGREEGIAAQASVLLFPL